MTLTKTAPKRPPAAHRKRTGTHHKHSPHYVKAYWPYLPIVAIMVLSLAVSNVMSGVHRDVKGYATEMSATNLLNETNNQRIANGLGALALNGKLNTAAQNKANDMAARDYWSHNTPDGQTPWTFITAAGYSYATAGENLAYGFATSADTVTGWMNSAPHRANILKSTYVDVGFGIINIPDYQNSGPQTLVVAMYASPAAAPAPAPTSTTTKTTTTSKKTATATPAPAPAPESTPAPETTPTPAPTEAVATKSKDDTLVAAQPAKTEPVAEKKVARIQVMTAGQASWSLAALTMIACGALLIFVVKHAIAWHRVIRRGERFMYHHPVWDFVIISLVAIGFVLSQTTGLIK